MAPALVALLSMFGGTAAAGGGAAAGGAAAGGAGGGMMAGLPMMGGMMGGGGGGKGMPDPGMDMMKKDKGGPLGDIIGGAAKLARPDRAAMPFSGQPGVKHDMPAPVVAGAQPQAPGQPQKDEGFDSFLDSILKKRQSGNVSNVG